MKSIDLMKELYKVIKQSGWLDKATEYMREHPERFDDCIVTDGKIANLNISVSYQPESLSAIADVKPSVFISIGHVNKKAEEFNVYATGTTQSCTWVDGKRIQEDIIIV